MYAIGIPLSALVGLLDTILWLYMLVIIATLILSWTNPDPLNPIVRVLRMLTEPVYDRVRRFIPLVGGLDLTPAVILAAIYLIRTGVLDVLARFARDLSN